jgi:hypothetical protein
VVAVGESPATGSLTCTHPQCPQHVTRVSQHAHATDTPACTLHAAYEGQRAPSQCPPRRLLRGSEPPCHNTSAPPHMTPGYGARTDTDKIKSDKAPALSITEKGGSRSSFLPNTLRDKARRAPPVSDGPCSGGTLSPREGSSVAPIPVPFYEGDTAKRPGAGVESSPPAMEAPKGRRSNS